MRRGIPAETHESEPVFCAVSAEPRQQALHKTPSTERTDGDIRAFFKHMDQFIDFLDRCTHARVGDKHVSAMNVREALMESYLCRDRFADDAFGVRVRLHAPQCFRKDVPLINGGDENRKKNGAVMGSHLFFKMKGVLFKKKNGTVEAVFKLHFRLPIQLLSRARDIGTALFRVVHR